MLCCNSQDDTQAHFYYAQPKFYGKLHWKQWEWQAELGSKIWSQTW